MRLPLYTDIFRILTVVQLVLSIVGIVGVFLQYDSIHNHNGLRNILITIGIDSAVCIGIAHLTARYLSRRISQPMAHITESAQRVIDTKTVQPITISEQAHLETATLGSTINELADSMNDSMRSMEKLQRIRSQFLANVSHELRTPIFSLQGYIETLLDGAVDDPDVARLFLEKANANALRLNTLLVDLIDISRIESGEMKMSFRFCNFADILHDCLSALDDKAKQNSITVQWINPLNEIMVFGDKERLLQVMTNIISNAIKYNVANGRVDISLHFRENKRVSIRVQDTGVGIAQEHIERVFERFYRVDSNRSRAVGGSGLGLAIVKHILEAHGTEAVVTSTPNIGTTIEFVLRYEP